MLGRTFARVLCRALGRHDPAAPIKRGDLGFYARCSHCGQVITKSGLEAWTIDHAIDPGALTGMRNVI
jgi:hypothetical protein